MESDVQYVQQICRVIQCKPNGNSAGVNLLEGESVDKNPEVVKEGDADHTGPPVAQSPRWVKHKGPVAAAVVRASGCRCLNPSIALDAFLAEIALDVLATLSALMSGRVANDVPITRPGPLHQRRLRQGEALAVGLDLIQPGAK